MKIFVIWNVKKKHLMTAKLCNLLYLFILFFIIFSTFRKRNTPFQCNFSLLYFNILPFPFYGYKWFNMYLCIWFYCIYLSSKLDELCFKFPFFLHTFTLFFTSHAILFFIWVKSNPMTIKQKIERVKGNILPLFQHRLTLVLLERIKSFQLRYIVSYIQ